MMSGALYRSKSVWLEKHDRLAREKVPVEVELQHQVSSQGRRSYSGIFRARLNHS